ncbi:Uma2 family endonuclease [Spirosoma arcticum]
MMTALSQAEPLPTTLQTVDEFEQWQRQYVTEGSYEFVRGRIIPKPAIKQEQVFIADFLVRRFAETESYRQRNSLLPETDSYVDGSRKRVPDLTYLTRDQQEAIRQGERARTRFAIEILSESESFQSVTDKVQDYFDGGAQLVWYVVPVKQKIYVYTSPDEIKVYKGTDTLSAAPVIDDFQFVVADLFA